MSRVCEATISKKPTTKQITQQQHPKACCTKEVITHEKVPCCPEEQKSKNGCSILVQQQV